MMDYYPSTVLIGNPIYSYVAPFQPRSSEQRNAKSEQTAFLTTTNNTVDFFTPETGYKAPTVGTISKQEATLEFTHTLADSLQHRTEAATEPRLSEEIDKIAKQRVQLMAIKYASDTKTAELLARLEILNNRLSKSAPRLSEEQVNALEAANEQLARIRAAREERSRRLGI